jgi:hypothetical protein
VARILVQTNDRRTVLDEADVHPADMSGTPNLLDRLERAVEEAERVRPTPRFRRRGAIPQAKDYREVSG